jgi:hypothetical protein
VCTQTQRYGIYSFVTALEKPLELRMREAGDMTSAVIRSQQMKDEQANPQSPLPSVVVAARSSSLLLTLLPFYARKLGSLLNGGTTRLKCCT